MNNVTSSALLNDDFSEELAFSLLQSKEEFPVAFDVAWQWMGYASKQAAKKKLGRNFELRVDYISEWINVAHSNGLTSSRSEEIYLSVECFKAFSMMAGTEKGRSVRAYFLQCEKIARKASFQMPNTLVEAGELWIAQLKENGRLAGLLEESKNENSVLVHEVRWAKDRIDEYHDVNQDLRKDVNTYKPKAEDYDLLEKREGFISGQELVKRLAVKNFSVRKLYDLLREKHILFKTKGETLNQPYQKYIDNGWIKVRDVDCPDGRKRPAPVFSWKAVVKIIKLMKTTGWISQDCEIFNWNFSEDEFMKSAEPLTNVVELRRA